MILATLKALLTHLLTRLPPHYLNLFYNFISFHSTPSSNPQNCSPAQRLKLASKTSSCQANWWRKFYSTITSRTSCSKSTLQRSDCSLNWCSFRLDFIYCEWSWNSELRWISSWLRNPGISCCSFVAWGASRFCGRSSPPHGISAIERTTSYPDI